MKAEKYIQELLYRYNCVVVPEFGAFLAQIRPARLHRASHTFDPPCKILSFNEQLASNDGLLVSYMANAAEVSYEEKLGELKQQVATWKKQLSEGKRITFSNIGELWLNREGKILFHPARETNYLTSSFGLYPVVCPRVTREVLKKEVVQLEEQIPFMITPEERNRHSIRPFLKYAAVVLLALSTGLTGFRLYEERQSISQLARQDAQEEVNRNIQEATFFNSRPLELPALNLEVKIKPKGIHHVVAGAFRVQQNADKKVRELRNKGYNATYIGANRYGLHQVTYESFVNPEEALQFLHRIKQTVSSDAWLLSER
jgi:nucleoid DNA-binding protein